MGAPRGGTEIEEERKQCGPAASPGSARTQAKRTTERTHRPGQPAHVAGIEATPAGSKIAKPVAKGNRRDRGEKRREVKARCHLSTTSQEREGEVPSEPPLDAQQRTTHHRAAKRPSSPAKNARARWTNDLVRYPPGGGRNRACFFHECQAPRRMARDTVSPQIRSIALSTVGLCRIPSTAFGHS